MDTKTDRPSSQVEDWDKHRQATDHIEATMDHKEPKITARAIMAVIATVFVYMSHMLHLTGTGFLSQVITADVGGRDKTAWLTLIITLFTVIAGPPVAQCADFWGRKWLLVGTALISCIGCLAFSRSDSIGMAIGCQVVASASLSCQSIAHAVPSEVLPRRFRPFAQLAVNVAAAFGAVCGLYAAGALVRSNPKDWRTYFYMLAGVYLTASVLVAIFYQPGVRADQRLSLSRKLHALDIPATLLVCVSLLMLCVGLGYYDNPYHFSNAHVLAPFLVGIAGLIGLLGYTGFYHKNGLIDHRLYRSRNFAVAQAGVFVEAVSFIGFVNYFGFEVNLVYGQSLFIVGEIYNIAYFASIASVSVVAIYCSRTKELRLPAILAFIFFLIYFILMATTNSTTPIANLWGYNVFIGLGLGAVLNPLVVIAQLSTPVELISTATGLLISTRALGAVVGLTIFNAVFNSTLQQNLTKKILAAVTPLGLPKSSDFAFIEALTTNNQTLLGSVPGVTPQIIEAGVGGLMSAYRLSFRNVWISSACFAGVALIIVLFLKDVKDQFTAHIDAPVKEGAVLHIRVHQNSEDKTEKTSYGSGTGTNISGMK